MKPSGRENRNEFETIIGNPFGMDLEEVLPNSFNIDDITSLQFLYTVARNSFLYKSLADLSMLLGKECDPHKNMFSKPYALLETGLTTDYGQ